MSGERLTVLHQDEYEGKSAKAVKKSLATYAGVCRFRQRLLVEDGSREIQDDETFDTSPLKVQLVLLEFCPPDDEQCQQMFMACENNDSVSLEKLLQHALQPDVKDEYGLTPLHEAVIEAGANIDAVDNNGATPMHIAARCGY